MRRLSEVSHHKSLDTLRGYARRVDLFKEHAGRRSCELTAVPSQVRQFCLTLFGWCGRLAWCVATLRKSMVRMHSGA